MRKIVFILLSVLLIMTGCSNSNKDKAEGKPRVKIGIMLSDVGLGDQSFSDAGFTGLEKARDELNISFDYREIKETKTYEKGLEDLVKSKNDLIIGLGFAMQEALEKTAKKYPKQKFLLIDGVSDLPNIYSLTFKEEEGSYLLGLIAGMKTKSNVVGFLGGMDVPLIRKFEKGFIAGVKQTNPNAVVISNYAGSFGDDKLGAQIAKGMIQKKADYIYPAAGFTGVGALLEAQRSGVFGFGVDSDQFYIAEKAVTTSMLKKIDVAVYNVAKELKTNHTLTRKHMVLGIKENGVGLAPIRIISLSAEEKSILKTQQEKLESGSLTIEP
ncbi:BMP family lipoprotein [Neobacillus terrae]|uniref:BMP family lipoprotein n=1 Tax=Neobacillus terrae TaxID=3034837 RepID=UPI001407C5B5|nr:BMP family ABC transporter substrate-binding protein [Neobacillus terrae]NHM32424.1 BMP family ABC transporter substrate-binding protein [Neobacillus terrae]